MVAIPSELQGFLESTPDVVHGAIRFSGTRVMVEVFLDTIADGYSLDQALENFPTIPREGARAVLAWQNDRAHQALGIPNPR